MIDIVEPNLHPIIVHFVIAFLITGPILLLLAALLPPDSKLRVSACHAGDWMMGLGLLAMIAAIAAGFQAYYSVAHDGPSHIAMTDHRNWAIVTATSFLAIGLYRLYKRGKAPTMGVFSSTVFARDVSYNYWLEGRTSCLPLRTRCSESS